jgi:hypothetical protein
MARWIVATLMVALSPVVVADDHEAAFDGEQIVPIQSTSIRMARERVEVFVEWPDATAAHALFRVCAEFVLVNDSPAARSILISFPGSYVDSGFARFVDGRAAQTTRHKAKDGRTWAYTSRVRFGPRQCRTVRVKYVGASDAFSAGPFEGRWAYLLRTGALWKGRIDEIRVVVHFPMYMPRGGVGPFDASALRLSPKGYQANGQTVTWLLRNVEPREDIVIDCDPARVRRASNPLRSAPREEAPGLQLQLALAHEAAYDTEGAARALRALRRAFPDSWAAEKVDFHLARLRFRHHEHDGRLWGSGPDAPAAVRLYEAALDRPLDREERVECLCQLLALYARVLEQPRRAERVLARLKRDLPPDGEERERVLEFIAAALPQGPPETNEATSGPPVKREPAQGLQALSPTLRAVR